MRRDYKIMFTDKSKANLWIHLDLAKVHHLKGLTSLCIISYLHFLNLNNIDSPQNFSCRWRLGFWHELCSPCFLPARFTQFNKLVYKIKTNASCLYVDFIFSSLLLKDWKVSIIIFINIKFHIAKIIKGEMYDGKYLSGREKLNIFLRRIHLYFPPIRNKSLFF